MASHAGKHITYKFFYKIRDEKISLIMALLLGNVGSLAYTSSMYNPFNDYVPELGMPLSQVNVYGGPQIQYLMEGASVNWNGNLRDKGR